jgi:hypothetical protein
MLLHLAIGIVSGIVVGLAVFSNPFSRAVVTGLIAGVVVGAIMVDGVEGYLNWAAYLPATVTKFAAFWSGLLAGIILSARFWSMRLP